MRPINSIKKKKKKKKEAKNSNKLNFLSHPKQNLNV